MKLRNIYLTSTSCITLSSVYYSILYNHYICSFFTFCVFLSSINYWRNPIHGLRRDIDRVTVIITLNVHIITLKNQQNFIYYLIISGTSVIFYIIAKILKKNNYIWLSVISHSMIHISANIANIILYIN